MPALRVETQVAPPLACRTRVAGPAPAAAGRELWRSALGLALLGAAGLALEIAWVMLWPLSYRLTHGGDYTYTYLVSHPAIWERLYSLLVLANTLVPGIEPPQTLDILVNALVATFALASLGYLAGVMLLDRGVAAGRAALGLIVGFGLLFQVTLFFLPGTFTTDTFSYVMYGKVSAVYDLNPYVYPPSAFPSDPLLAPGWIQPIWHNTPSVYGPLWTDVGWVMARLTHALPLVDQVFAYRLLMNVVHLANLALVWWLLGRLRLGGGSYRARLTAFAVFAWNPLVLFDVPGNAHNDGLMVTLLLLALVPLALTVRAFQPHPPSGADPAGGVPAGRTGSAGGARRAVGRPSLPSWAWLVGLVCVALSALVKYTTGLVGLFYGVVWLRRLESLRSRLLWGGAAAVLLLGLTLLLAAPWLNSPAAFGPILNAAEGNMYTNSIPDLAALTLADRVLDPRALDPEAAHQAARFWMKVATRLAFLLYLAWEVRRLWRHGLDDGRAVVGAILAASVRAFLVLLVVVLTWVLEWYFLWPLALATLLGWRRLLTRVAVAFTLTSLPIFYVHHYWSWHMPGALLFLYVGPPLLLGAIGWWIERRRAAEPVVAPAQARSAAGRAAAPSLGLSAAVAAVADPPGPLGDPRLRR